MRLIVVTILFFVIETSNTKKHHKHLHAKNIFDSNKRNRFTRPSSYKHPLQINTTDFDRIQFFNERPSFSNSKKVKLFYKNLNDNELVKKYKYDGDIEDKQVYMPKDSIVKTAGQLNLDIDYHLLNKDIKPLSNLTNATQNLGERLSNSSIKEKSRKLVKLLSPSEPRLNSSEKVMIVKNSSTINCSSEECTHNTALKILPSQDRQQNINSSKIHHNDVSGDHLPYPTDDKSSINHNENILGRVDQPILSIVPDKNDVHASKGGIEDRGYHRSHSDLLTSDSIHHINYLPIHDESQHNIDIHTEFHHTNASDNTEDDQYFQSYPELTASEKTTHINYSPIHLESHKYLAPIHTHVNHASDYMEDGETFPQTSQPQIMSLKNTHQINYSPMYEESHAEPIHSQIHKVGYRTRHSKHSSHLPLPFSILHQHHHHHKPNTENIERYTEHRTGEFYEQPCLHGGEYFNMGEQGYQCVCNEGFTGFHCQEINYCYPQPCFNGGACHPVVHDPFFICQCKVGFIGPICNDTSPCYPNPCKNDGVCSHNGTAITCDCTSRYTGAFCEKLKNCLPNPCQNGGSCMELDGEGKFKCQCQSPWKGALCTDFDYCNKNPCENGGVCLEGSGNFSCKCPIGFSGVMCQDHVCLPNPCLNGGTCLESGNKFKCLCPKWASGELCEENKPCLINPCLNGGKCVDGNSGFQWSFGALQYYCLCKPPYKGVNCEHHGCKHCDKNAHCVVDHCVCDPGYEGNGLLCHKKENSCHPNPCFNNGQCRESPASCEGDNCWFTCVCLPPYLPPLCKEANPCIPNPCENGECQSVGDGNIICKCNEGFKGKRCEEVDACLPNPCQHNGKCHSVKGIAECICEGMWRTPFCKECGCPAPHITGIPDMSCSLNGACTCPRQWVPDMVKGVCSKTASPGCNSPCCTLPCDNGGTCVDLPNGSFRCYCKTGTTGKVCQFKTVCNPSPCMNGGVCSEKDGKFLGCLCPPNFLPPYCMNPDIRGNFYGPILSQSSTTGLTMPYGLCNPNPCFHKGVCILNRGGYDCVCIQRYTGPHCEVDRCAKCHIHARCIMGECKCKKGWIGNGLNCIQEMCEETCVEWSTCINGNCVCNADAPHISHKCVPLVTDFEVDDFDDDSDRTDKTVHPTPTFVSPLLITHQTVPTRRPKVKGTTKASKKTSHTTGPYKSSITSTPKTGGGDGSGPPSGSLASHFIYKTSFFKSFLNES